MAMTVYCISQRNNDESNLGDQFDRFRQLRNDINYYGRDVSGLQAKPVLDGMTEFIGKLKSKFF